MGGHSLAARIRRYFPLKFIGTSLFCWAFFVGYFEVLAHPVYPVTIMPLTALDLAIPFQPHALLLYLSLWVYVGVAPGLQFTLPELVVYTLWIGAMCLTGLACFYFWPTQIPPLALDVSDSPGFELLRRVDATGNACPSMHVAGAMFTAIRIDDVLRWTRSRLSLRLLNAGWLTAIAYSTLAVKQHVALDVIAGALLGIAFAVASLYWRPARMPQTSGSPA